MPSSTSGLARDNLMRRDVQARAERLTVDDHLFIAVERVFEFRVLRLDPNAIEAVVREIPEPKLSTVSLSTAGGTGTSWSSKSSGRTAYHPMRRPCAGPAWGGEFKEVLMVRTIVRAIEPSIYDVRMFRARCVTDRPGP